MARNNTFPAGCMPPSGYMFWHEWADAQGKAGLAQKRCPTCSLFRFPQEMTSATTCTY